MVTRADNGMHRNLAFCSLIFAFSVACQRDDTAATSATSVQQRPLPASPASPVRSKTPADAREFKSPADAQEYKAIQTEMNLVGKLTGETNAHLLDLQAQVAELQARGQRPNKAELHAMKAELQRTLSELLSLKARLLRVQARFERLKVRAGGNHD
jgi:hypothetical protein